MEVSEEVRAAHQDLSPVASRFLDYALAHTEVQRRLEFKSADGVPEWMRGYTFELQSWPVFLGAEKLRQISRATVEVTRLVRSIPERIFHNDAHRITEFYGWNNEFITALLLEPPNGLDNALTRCDFIDGEDGFKCVEINASANIGGWQLRFWERVCRTNPSIAPFLIAENELRPFHRDPWFAAFLHIMNETRRTGIADDEINVALITNREHPIGPAVQSDLNDLYEEVLASAGPGLSGHVLGCVDYEELIVRGVQLSVRGQRVHAVLDYGGGQVPRHVYRCFKAEAVGLYNGPLGELLGDKRNLALLSQLEESDLLTAAERTIVRDHVPWSREAADGRTTFRGETMPLLDFAKARRESLVLKPADGRSGLDVFIGSQTSPQEWSARLETAAASRGYLLQEYVRSWPFLFQYGPAGCALHDLVWGTFCFGENYGGGFIRMLPRDRGPSVINSARGACEGIMFEV